MTDTIRCGRCRAKEQHGYVTTMMNQQKNIKTAFPHVLRNGRANCANLYAQKREKLKGIQDIGVLFMKIHT